MFVIYIHSYCSVGPGFTVPSVYGYMRVWNTENLPQNIRRYQDIFAQCTGHVRDRSEDRSVKNIEQIVGSREMDRSQCRDDDTAATAATWREGVTSVN